MNYTITISKQLQHNKHPSPSVKTPQKQDGKRQRVACLAFPVARHAARILKPGSAIILQRKPDSWLDGFPPIRAAALKSSTRLKWWWRGHSWDWGSKEAIERDISLTPCRLWTLAGTLTPTSEVRRRSRKEWSGSELHMECGMNEERKGRISQLLVQWPCHVESTIS